ncbi:MULTISPECIES: GNAT family N-acetyltransferase [Paenibacillus]|uniref:RimJ/RimL family protein N-acetyltransferase n=1 Tax=Paenibacillus brasilensis TaxID=128574 RepID=A0ABU0KZ30_9BACL|nr:MULTISPECIES: GNAT family protein [Paenibacillus]MDQ0494683.1 RimJ/RimL family protein N-acetyltransferase [Paenibacillus brasilensis]
MPHIIGERIVLREYRLEDIPDIRKWVNDPEITHGLSDVFIYPHSQFNSESFVQMMVDGSSEIKGFVIAHKDTLDYIGQLDLFKINWVNRHATLGIVIGCDGDLGKGYGREAIRLIQKFAFHALNLHRLELEVYAFNERAHRCYLACGFKEEGRLREKLFREGKYYDIIQMGILRSEYEAVEQAKES